MKATIDGTVYDTENAEEVGSGDEGDGSLLRTPDGHFFKECYRLTLRGMEGLPHERTTFPASLNELRASDEWRATDDNVRVAACYFRIIVPLTRRGALEWSIDAFGGGFKDYLRQCISSAV